MTKPQATIRPSALHRLLIPQPIKSIEIERDFIIIRLGDGSKRVPLAQATLTASSTWLILKSLVLQTSDGPFTLSGITPDDVGKLQAAIVEASRRQSVLDTLTTNSANASDHLQSWEDLTRRDAYVTARNLSSWVISAAQLATIAEEDADLLERLPDGEQRTWRKVFTTKANGHKSVLQRNAAYAQHQLQSYAEFFDSVESNPLTEQQRDAIVHDEDNTLVIAGAGTGKTSTIVGKVGYILKKGLAQPDEILLLAFTSKAAEEMRERMEKKLGIAVKVRTFHGLGLEIISQAERKKPSLCPEAEDSVVKAQTIKKLIVMLISDSTFCQNLMLFQAALRRPYKPAWKFKSLAQYTQYLLDAEPRALTGRLLKSYEECEIANWLFVNGIRAEYEQSYSVDTSTGDHRQYKPDFFLPDFDIYIEHWGVDHDDNTAPFVNRAAYIEKMTWARELHAANGTMLVETYSWERQEGILLSSLEAKLREHGVEPQPISKDDALTLLNDAGRFDPLVTLISTFTSLFKSACISFHELRLRQIRDGDAKRNAWFVGIFEKLMAEYDQLIHGRGEIDFDDMISLAREHVERGSYRSQFRYILVDEFQDIALARARLIQALRDQVDGAKLFAVGDDWQSIYRFTGSDISLTTDFSTHFGDTHRTMLDRTYRFHDKLADFSSRFVQKNPTQIRKQLTTSATSNEPGVVIWMTDEQHDPLDTILAEIAAQGSAFVFILSRYRHGIPSDLNYLKRRFPNLALKAMTAHASKGLEADYVVINHLKSGKYGFPSETASDPVLALVQEESEQFEFAEERRLFYVALTRAKVRAHLIADAVNMSVFVQEIIEDDRYEKTLRVSSTASTNICPICERGTVLKRAGEFGGFYGCSNFPICTYKSAACSRCKRGRIRRDDNGTSECDACGFKGRVCPACEVGELVIRRAKQSGRTFWGCSRFGARDGACSYTETTTGI